jgi:hypothetical protein
LKTYTLQRTTNFQKHSSFHIRLVLQKKDSNIVLLLRMHMPCFMYNGCWSTLSWQPEYSLLPTKMESQYITTTKTNFLFLKFIPLLLPCLAEGHDKQNDGQNMPIRCSFLW